MNYNEISKMSYDEISKTYKNSEKILEQNQEIIKLFSRYLNPAWIQDLIDKAYIEPDGKTAICSLDDIAKAIRNNLNRQITTQHLERFVKKDGKAFSKSSITNAVTKANSPD